jgi:uncharacterized delta-60 repeat protein
MFTKQYLVVLLLLGFLSELVADKFARTFGDPLETNFYYVLQTSDGGYIAGGNGLVPGAAYVDALLVKLDSAGTLEWAKAYGTTSEESGISARLTSDGGYIIAGTAFTILTDSYDVLVMKCNSAGTVQWAKTFGDPVGGTWHRDYGYDVDQTSDGGYIVTGLTGTLWDNDISVLKLSSTGTVQWAKTYHDTLLDYALSIQQTSDAGYIVAGYTKVSSDPAAALVLKLSSAGAIQWAKTFGGISSVGEDFRAVQQTSDGGYIVVGSTYSYGAGSGDILLVKLSSAGDLEWAKTFGGTGADFGYSIRQTSDGGYIVAGITLSYGAGLYDFLVMKLSSEGDLAWARTFGGSDVDYVYRVLQTSDSGYILAGYTRSYGAGYNDLLVLKLESDGVYDSCLFDCTPTVTSLSPATSSTSVVVSNWTPVNGSLSMAVSNLTYSVDDVCAPVVVAEEDVGSDTSGSLYLDVIPSVGKNNFCIKYGIPKSGDISNELPVSLKLYNIAGRVERVLLEKNIRCQCGSYTRHLNLSDLPVGIYFLRLEVGTRCIVKKLVLLF